MKVIPVLDLLNGQVVHGIQGRRNLYKPITSQVVKTSDPLEVVQQFGHIFGFKRFYIADLNAIQRVGDNYHIIQQLKEKFPTCSFMIDVGVRNVSDIMIPSINSIDTLVLGTETLKSLAELDKILQAWEPSKIIISLDLKSGRLLHVPTGFQDEISSFLQTFMTQRISEIIVIDLAKVGSRTGPLYRELEQIRLEFQGNIIVGGGVRNAADLEDLQRCGFNGALVATALHSGKLSPQEIVPYL